MRNRIYRYVLVDHTHPILLVESDHHQPALLRTCKQIREEALGIFYSENQFILGLVGLEVRPQLEHWLWKETQISMAKVICAGRMEWSAMMPWLRLIHARKVDLVTRFDWIFVDNEFWGSILNDAISIVWALRHTPWKATLKALEISKRAMERTNGSVGVDPALWA